ncbi:MAG TPA: ComEC/Rec2 family competence protein, partial [Flavobacterium sp.]|nr:ComEC/Rec2 family competence protein [Flavobacterium sp.]
AIVGLEPFYKKLRTRYRALNYVTDTLLVSLAAQVGVLPLSLYYFNQFPLLFLLANLIVIPLSNLVLVLGIVVLLLNFIWTGAAILTGKALEIAVQAMNGFIGWVASFDSLVLKNIPFTLLLNLALYGVISAGIWWLYKKSYRRTLAFLSMVLLFQCIFAVTAIGSRLHEEFVVFHSRKGTSLAIKDSHSITVYSTDSLALQSADITAYNKANFNQPLVLRPVQNMLWFGQRKVLVIDNNALYEPNIKPDILILAQSPKLNLERVIAQLKPKQIIADGTNRKHLISLWASTCEKQKIPFHATAEKGFYSIK